MYASEKLPNDIQVIRIGLIYCRLKGLNFEGEFVHVFLRTYVQCVHVRVANIIRGVMRVCKYNIHVSYMGKASKCICVDSCHELVKNLAKLMKLEDPCMNDSLYLPTPLSLSPSLPPLSLSFCLSPPLKPYKGVYIMCASADRAQS